MRRPASVIEPGDASSKPGDHAQRRGLAAARRPEQRDDLALAHVDVQRLHRMNRLLARSARRSCRRPASESAMSAISGAPVCICRIAAGAFMRSVPTRAPLASSNTKARSWSKRAEGRAGPSRLVLHAGLGGEYFLSVLRAQQQHRLFIERRDRDHLDRECVRAALISKRSSSPAEGPAQRSVRSPRRASRRGRDCRAADLAGRPRRGRPRLYRQQIDGWVAEQPCDADGGRSAIDRRRRRDLLETAAPPTRRCGRQIAIASL